MVILEIWMKRYVPGWNGKGEPSFVELWVLLGEADGGSVWRTRKLLMGSEVKTVPSTTEGSGLEIVTRIL